MGALVLGATGIVAATGGAYLWLSGEAQHSAVADECGGTTGCAGDSGARYDDSESAIISGQIGVAVGGAALIGGVVWWAFSSQTGELPEDQVELARSSFSLSPLTGGAYASVQGAF